MGPVRLLQQENGSDDHCQSSRDAALRAKVVEQFGVDAAFKQCAEGCILEGCIEKEGYSKFPGKEPLSVLMAYGARPSPESLIGLSRTFPYKEFRDCCLEAVGSADNPFIPGMTLSVELWNAAKGAGDGDKGPLIDAQAEVDAELLKRFGRLSPTVRGFDGHMAGCSEVFEPEERRGIGDVSKPLALALQGRKQRQFYCMVPLVMDFLSRRFTYGLPNLRDTTGVLDDNDELQRLGRGLTSKEGSPLGHDFILGDNQKEGVDKAVKRSRQRPETPKGRTLPQDPRISMMPPHRRNDPPIRKKEDTQYKHTIILGSGSWLASLRSPGALLQGANARFPSLSILPGAQFAVAGLAGRPSSFYRVPAMRMVLDLVAYLGMLGGFISLVLFLKDGELMWGDFAVFIYVVVRYVREGFDVVQGLLHCMKTNGLLWKLMSSLL